MKIFYFSVSYLIAALMFCCMQFCVMSEGFAQTKASSFLIAARHTSAKKSMVGIASYYADKFEGKKTASGE